MPDTSTEVAIATTTLGSAASSITFSSIPNTYTDLRIVLTAASTGSELVHIRFNGNTGTNYSMTQLQGNGGNAESIRQTNQSSIRVGNMVSDAYGPNFRGLTIIDIFSYAGSTNKTFLSEGNSDTNGQGIVARRVGLWRSTAAITEVRLLPNPAEGGNFTTGTTATLYGIL